MDGNAVLRICLIIMVVALVMSRSRMANVSFFLSFNVVGVIALLWMKDKRKSLSILLVSLLVVDVLVMLATDFYSSLPSAMVYYTVLAVVLTILHGQKYVFTFYMRELTQSRSNPTPLFHLTR